MKAVRIFFYLAVTALGGLCFALFIREPAVTEASSDLVALGRAVYISEGCVHCHSQFVRPVGEHMRLWGARTSVEAALAQSPVLIGNRRQGPDLANVGMRRSAEWNQLHLTAPAQLVPGSRMPSYPHLFAEGRGEGVALLAYLQILKPELIVTDNVTLSPIVSD